MSQLGHVVKLQSIVTGVTVGQVIRTPRMMSKAEPCITGRNGSESVSWERYYSSRPNAKRPTDELGVNIAEGDRPDQHFTMSDAGLLMSFSLCSLPPSEPNILLNIKSHYQRRRKKKRFIFNKRACHPLTSGKRSLLRAITLF